MGCFKCGKDVELITLVLDYSSKCCPDCAVSMIPELKAMYDGSVNEILDSFLLDSGFSLCERLHLLNTDMKAERLFLNDYFECLVQCVCISESMKLLKGNTIVSGYDYYFPRCLYFASSLEGLIYSRLPENAKCGRYSIQADLMPIYGFEINELVDMFHIFNNGGEGFESAILCDLKIKKVAYHLRKATIVFCGFDQ